MLHIIKKSITNVFCLTVLFFLTSPSIYANDIKYAFSTGIEYHLKKNFEYNLNSDSIYSLKLESALESQTYKSNFAVKIDKNSNLSYDGSKFEYISQNSLVGFGKIDRHWGFSPKSSVVLSDNARPANSVYFIYDSTKKPVNLVHKIFGDVNLELFNSLLKNANGPRDSMLFGARLEVSPHKNLDLELFRISQWGGHEYGNSLGFFVW